MKRAIVCLFAVPLLAQHEGHHMHGHTTSNEPGMFLMSQASGTSMNPKSWMMPMIMKQAGAWNLMFMGTAFLVDTQQAGPRGHASFIPPTGLWFRQSIALAGEALCCR